jgi:hypothetical protein
MVCYISYALVCKEGRVGGLGILVVVELEIENLWVLILAAPGRCCVLGKDTLHEVTHSTQV